MNTILFDMDGVLINSEPVTMRAAAEALAKEGISVTREDFLPFIGAGEEHFIIGPCERYGKADRISVALENMYLLYDKYVKDELMVYPDAAETITSLHDAGFTLALVSSSAQRKLLSSLNAAKIPPEAFDLILSGNDVTNKKPSPEPYQTAALRLNKTPADCIVIEDALNGVTSAKSAEMYCAVVTTSFSAGQLKEAGADYILDGLSEIPNVLK